MKFKVLATAAALALALFTGTMEKAQANDGQLFGAVIGGATGGYLGSNIGSGKGQLAATAAGTLLGAVIGSNMATAGDYEPYGTRYRVHYPKPQPKPVYVAPKPKRKVVVHKHHIVVKHVYPDGYRGHGKAYGKSYKKRMKAEKHRKWKREKYRRKLAQACYDHPRRCSKAF